VTPRSPLSKKEADLVPPTNIHCLNSIGAEDFKQETVKERMIASHAKRGEYGEELIMEQWRGIEAF